MALPTQTSFYSLSDVCSVAWCWLFHVRVPVRLCVCLPWRSVSVSCFLDPPSVPFSWTRCSPSVSSSVPVGFCPKLTLVLNQQALFSFELPVVSQRSFQLRSHSIYDLYTSPNITMVTRFVTHGCLLFAGLQPMI